MIRRVCIMVLTVALFCLGTPPLRAEDMRDTARQRSLQRTKLAQQVADEQAAAVEKAERQRVEILENQQELAAAVDGMTHTVRDLKNENRRLKERLDDLSQKEKVLDDALANTDSVLQELIGHARTGAKDLDSLVARTPEGPLSARPADSSQALFNENRFPSMDDLSGLVSRTVAAIRRSGEVRKSQRPFVDRSGRQAQGEVLFIGPFTAAYRRGDETGFLTRTGTGPLFALSKLPPAAVGKKLAAYMDGESDTVPMDISQGAALRQLTHRLNLWEQITNGGPIVWPILAIGALAVLIVLERTVYLLRRRFNAEGFMHRLREMADSDLWSQCTEACRTCIAKPVPRVLLAGLDARHLDREEMENVLQEAILKEIPGLERFLSTLGMLAAIAPLLGLLGTVTGMINTFHAITAFGTGDPRMMSGGISEALVTTMLGLSVAVPIVFAHTLLSRRVETLIAQMEEKAVALVNLIHKSRNESCTG